MMMMPTEDAKPRYQKLRSGRLDSETMTRALEYFRADPMPPIKDAGPVFERGIEALIGRTPIHTCKRTDEQFQRSHPQWAYAAWLTDEEWMLIRMKWF